MKRLIIAAMIPLAFLLTSCGEKKINPNDYLTIVYDGYSEAATATVSLDVNKMIADYPGAFKLGKNYSQSDLNKVIDSISKSTLGQLSKTEGISNGDEISFSWDKNALSALEGSYKIKWSGYKEIKETVSDLPELEKLNPFDYVKVSFDGKSPHIVASFDISQFTNEYNAFMEDVKTKSGMTRSVYYDFVDFKEEYASGDKILVRFRVYNRATSKFNDEDVVELCKSSGYLITQTEKEYTVE